LRSQRLTVAEMRSFNKLETRISPSFTFVPFLCKKTIPIGNDTNRVAYDPNYRGKISAKTHLMNLNYNSFEGFEIAGRPHVVTVRGKVAARDGKFVGEVGRGKLLTREPTHF
jgi:dihydropyrimidinase